MFTIEMLPAGHGDSLWIEYGDPDRPHRVLIDGGPNLNATGNRSRELITERVDTRHEDDNDFELMVVTHVDADHITGMLKLMEETDIELAPRDFWFNAYHHLPTDVLGAKQGENLTAAVNKRRLNWNTDFDQQAAVVPDEGPLPRIELPGGMVVTLLSPTNQELRELRPVWEKEVKKAGLVPGFGMEEEEEKPADVLGAAEDIDPDELAEEPFEEDGSEANGASIAFLAEFDGKSMLLTGDAHAGVLERGIARLLEERDAGSTLDVDLFKVSHHGSRHNLSRELVDLVSAERWLFSSNGRIFKHPSPVAVSRLVVGRDDIELALNYRTEFNEHWDSRRRTRRYDYRTLYPDEGREGLLVER